MPGGGRWAPDPTGIVPGRLRGTATGSRGTLAMPQTDPDAPAPPPGPRDQGIGATSAVGRRVLATSSICLVLALLPTGSLPAQVPGGDAGRVADVAAGPTLTGVGDADASPDLTVAARATSPAAAIRVRSSETVAQPQTAPASRPAPPQTTPPESPAHGTTRYTGRVLLKLAPASQGDEGAADQRTALDALARAAGTSLAVTRQTATGGTLVEVDGSDPVRAAQRLAAQPGVEYALPERRFTALTDPNDPGFTAQWNLQAIRAPQAWPYATGAGARVAVLDSGSANHPDLVGRYLPGYDFVSDLPTARDGDGRDPDPADPGNWELPGQCGAGQPGTPSTWHGLHVAGIIAALTGNGQGIAGIAPQTDLLPVRVLGPCGGGTTDITDGIVWAAGGSVPGVPANTTPAKIINLSLASPGACTTVEQRAIDVARARGALVIVAAGNSGGPVSASAPANCRGVLVVGSSTAAGTGAAHSNHGPAVALAAPGVGIWGLANSGVKGPDLRGWGTLSRSGTSTATPQVSAAAALVWSVAPSLSADDVRAILRRTTTPFGGSTGRLGTGVLDVAAAVKLARPQPIAAPTIASVSQPGARSVGGDVLRIVGTGLTGARVTIGGATARIRGSSATALDVVIPAGPAGSTRLTVSTAGGSASRPFFYAERYVIRRQGSSFTPVE